MKKDENARVTVYPMATMTNGAGYCREQKKARPGGFEPPTYRFVVCRSIRTELRARR